ncbi:MAG: mechanosensitive ion channel family protein [Rubrimonas sp.]|uniref:mechanosensitive ion channel family protein n=1 Tax=Rubrimonas sp. TaxID=2036015 RepID=UPI002FDE46F4
MAGLRDLLLARVLALLLVAFAATASSAQAQRPDDPIEAALHLWTSEADSAREVLDKAAASDDALTTMRQRLEGYREEARALVAATAPRIAQIERELAALGPPPAEGVAEDEALAAERQALNDRLAAASSVRARAAAFEGRFSSQIEEVNLTLRDRLVSRVMQRGRTPLDPRLWIEATADAVEIGRRIGAETSASFADAAVRARAIETGPIALLALVLGLGLLIVARRRVIAWVEKVAADPASTREKRIGAGAVATLARLALPVSALYLIVFAVALSGLLGETLETLLTGAGYGFGAVIATYAFSSAYFAPDAPNLRVAALDDRQARIARNAAMTLSIALAIGLTLVRALDQLRVDPELLIAANLALVLTSSAAMLRLRHVYAPQAAEAETRTEEAEGEAESERTLAQQLRWLIRLALLLVALATPLLSLAGYLAASNRLGAAAIYSLGILGLCALLFSIVESISESASERLDPPWRKVARLAPLIAGFILTLGAAPLFAMAWGARWDDVAFALRSAMSGFDVGGFRISPVEIAAFLGVFGLGWLLTGAVQRVLRVSVLPQLDMEQGARTAITSGVGYVGVIAAFFIAVSSAGADLSNLAIVAGALSVGIGFGLQTVVSNFVSGVILLIERPINVGDWIMVNGQHGTVRKINVRSTEIQLFDRSDYIVPNADLISQPVTNFTRRNTVGRLILQVGVAYSADVRKVEAILRDVAAANMMVLRRPPPQILFRKFGADSLEFELRVFLRDVGNTLSVETDLHFRITERFRAEGIEIPFGQRDIWLRNPEALAGALRAAPAGEDPEVAKPEVAAGPVRRRRVFGAGEADADGDGDPT